MSGRGVWWAVAVVAVVTAWVHAGTLDGGFVYDDHRFIEHNDALADVSLVEAFRDPATASAGEGIVHDIYRPLRTLLFAAQYRLFVDRAADGTVEHHLPRWHAVSILLHLLNTVLVLRLLLPLVRGAVLPATAGALVFGVHPLTSESVAWLSSQGDLLAMTFLLGALLVLERRGPVRAALGGACFLLACLAKESALMLPLLLPLRDLALPREEGRPWARATWIHVALLAALTGAYLALRAAVLPGLAQVGHAQGSVFATARAMADGLTWYARGLLWPEGFSFDTRLDVPLRWSDPEVWVGLGVLGTTVAAGVYGLRTRRWLLAFACLGVLVALGPVSNVLVPLKTFVADRFFYPALICVAAGVAALLHGMRAATPRAAVATLLAGAVLALALVTAGRSEAWSDDGALWRAVRDDRPWNANAYQGLAFEAAQARRIKEAENAYATYLEANPFDAKSMFQMGSLFGEMARGLVLIGQNAPGEEVTTPVRRKQARLAEIRLYQRAFEVWDQPGGLAIGRGSPAMVVAMLDQWIEAGTDLGDLATAKFANDRAIEWEAQAPIDVADPEAVESRASWRRRRARTDFAIRAVKAHADRRVPRGMRAEVARQRAMLLTDAGFDPNRSDAALRGAFIDRLEVLEREALEDGRFLPDEPLYLELAALNVGPRPGLDDLERALRVLERGMRVLGPEAAVLAQEHALLKRDVLERRRGGGG